ncbi:MAG: MetS family NSS transporter small subunit [Thermovenabulum sp.]
MRIGSIITMVIILGMVWGGLLYLLNIAFKAK